jgi:hypothetical protein
MRMLLTQIFQMGILSDDDEEEERQLRRRRRRRRRVRIVLFSPDYFDCCFAPYREGRVLMKRRKKRKRKKMRKRLEHCEEP